MAQSVVNDPPCADIPRIKDRYGGLRPLALRETGGFAFEGGLHQRVDRRGCLGQIELVDNFKVCDPVRQLVIVVDHLDRELADRRMRDELRAEHFHHIGAIIGRIDQAFGGEDQDRVGAVERHPLAALVHPRLDLRGLFRRRHQVAGVGDEEAALVEPLQPRIVCGDRGADVRVFGQQLEDLEPRIVDIVVLARGDEMGVDAGGGLLCHSSS